MSARISNDKLKELFYDRVNFWLDQNAINYEDKYIYYDYYEKCVDSDFFDDQEVDVEGIVDNDVINYCHILSKGNDYYDVVNQHYIDTNDEDISSITPYSTIKLYDDDREKILVSY